MQLTYQEISREIGYAGYVPYPPKESVKSLALNLCENPTVEDFKLALRIFRFAPEAQTHGEVEMINMLDAGLGSARSLLSLSSPSWSLSSYLKYYAIKLIPSLSLFYTLRLILADNPIGIL